MGLFRKLFGRGKPAPPPLIHPQDQELVTEMDPAWWNTLTLKKLAKMEEHDEAARVAIIIDQMEDKGEPEEAAARHAMRSLPWYYGKLEERENKILNLVSDAAGLPWILKGRVVEAVLAGKIKKEDLEQSSSVNALIRRLMRAGSI